MASFGDTVTPTRVQASIIAANTATDVDFVGGATNSFDSDGDNLIGDGNATGNFDQTGDQTEVSDPGLGGLADNGGPTQTHALMAESPAIDAVMGICPPPATDQRGEDRPQGPACDIGSFEIMAAPSPDLSVGKTDSPDPVLLSDHLTYTITVNNAGQGDATGVMLTDTLPASVAFVSVSPSGSCGETVAGTVECDLGDLASGANATVTIVVQPTATGTLTNSVTVESAETDENPDNNTDIMEDTTVVPVTCDGLPATTIGTPGNNVIIGTNGPDVIHGLSGNDAISGRSGNDRICGGNGRDAIAGANGSDRLFGDEGDDALSGGNGNDALDGGADRDACSGGSGSDTGVNCELFQQ
ncbi:MAG: choice-of-anchor Q domain-containing protein [bacterium]